MIWQRKTYLLFNLVLLCNLKGVAQEGFIPLNHFFKDRLYHATDQYEGYRGNSFFPVTQNSYNLHDKIKDSSIQKNLFTRHLFQKHLFEIKGEDYYFKISPVFNFSFGKDFSNPTQAKLFQNTRGFHVEGDIFKNFSFSTSFYENQSRNVIYQANYFRQLGEGYYQSADSSYASQNAVIPGMGRTKPFKGDAFDYAFAMGDIVYRPFKVLTLSAGNTRKFIGDGYRSMLLSDNSFNAMNLQINYRFLPKFELIVMRAKHLNLLRRPIYSTIESYYQPKVYAVNYISYQATKDLSISLFEGTEYSKGDSLASQAASPWMYNPVPIIGGFVTDRSVANTIVGINVGYSIRQIGRLYGQFAMNTREGGFGGQLGVRILEPGKVRNLFLQLEGNLASKNLYRSENPNLNLAHFNLPLAHVKGEGFAELVVRANYEWKRIYIDLKGVYYQLNNYSERDLLSLYEKAPRMDAEIIHLESELGYRFNKRMNFSVFVNYLNRIQTESNGKQVTSYFSFGIKTSLINSYFDL